MTKFFIYARDPMTRQPGKLLGWLNAESRIHAAWLAWKKWPKHSSIYVELSE